MEIDRSLSDDEEINEILETPRTHKMRQKIERLEQQLGEYRRKYRNLKRKYDRMVSGKNKKLKIN